MSFCVKEKKTIQTSHNPHKKELHSKSHGCASLSCSCNPRVFLEPSNYSFFSELGLGRDFCPVFVMRLSHYFCVVFFPLLDESLLCSWGNFVRPLLENCLWRILNNGFKSRTAFTTFPFWMFLCKCLYFSSVSELDPTFSIIINNVFFSSAKDDPVQKFKDFYKKGIWRLTMLVLIFQRGMPVLTDVFPRHRRQTTYLLCPSFSLNFSLNRKEKKKISPSF